MPRSPLPQRDGLDAAWIRTPADGPWTTLRDHLIDRIPHLSTERIDAMFAEGRWCDEQGEPLPHDAPFIPHRFVWFHRDLPDEVEVPFDIHIVYRDDHIVVADKPPFLSVIPRGNHVRQSVVVRLRHELGLPELSPAHRLDRVTSGLVLLTTHRGVRAPYQQLFEQRRVDKRYHVIAPLDESLRTPRTVESHIVKDRGVWQAREIDAPANAATTIQLMESHQDLGLYTAVPHTGKTHQIRLHFLRLGLPIVNDPLYPSVTVTALDDFSRPLQLLAQELSFTDPLTGEQRHFQSRRHLHLPREAA